MSRKQRSQVINYVVIAVVALLLGIVFIPMIEVSAEAVTNETFMFKFVDWFTKIQTNLVDNAAFYLLVAALITLVLYLRRYLRAR